jgi:exonuclease III
MKNIKNLLTLSAVLFLSLTTLAETEVPPPKPAGFYTPQSDVSKSVEFSVMTFNVENLFDLEHDKGTEDYTYLPLKKKKTFKEAQQFCNDMRPGFYQTQCKELDWNKKVLTAKLSSIEKVIKYVEKGQGPDNILFAEVENEKVLKQLVQKNLKGLGYKTVVLIEGPDLRGIDPAFISKFPMAGKPQLHIIPFTDSDPEALKKAQRSRGILEVTVKAPNGNNVTFLAAHFPSQSNPTQWREQAVRFANDLIKKYQAEGRTVILGGDLNIIASEEAKHSYFKNILSETTDVSHLVGCKHCEGSHNYRGDWSFLDVLAFSKNLKTLGFELIPESIQAVKSPFNVDDKGLPLRFDEKTLQGVTDHLPIYARVRVK